MQHWLKTLQTFGYHSSLMYNLRMLIAFAGAAIVPYMLNEQIYTVPLALGIVAAGLSDIDDRFSVRIMNLVYTYVGFFITSVSIYFLFPYPILFAIGLLASCVVFILLGSLGRRYATISYGCLLISVYSMLGHDLFDQWYLQASLLVIGAMWYGVLSTLAFLLFPVREVQQKLSASYAELGNFLFSKSNVFDVDMTPKSYQQSLIDLSLENGRLITLFNEMRTMLLTRLKGDRGQKDTRRSLHYYFVAQDIHERADSAHIDYQRLSQLFQHSDILFRFQRILSMQGKACRDLSQNIIKHEQYRHSSQFKIAFHNLRLSLEKVRDNGQHDPVIVNALFALFQNLKAIDAQFSNLATERQIQSQLHEKSTDQQLVDDDLKGWQDILIRIKQNFTPESVLFRHAIRLSIVLFFAYIFVQATDIANGYWILLTALFVLQPNFNATKRRLNLRIIGTLAGISCAYAILTFIPSLEGQLLLLVLSGVLFFELRSKQYAQATAFMTILAMINFNLDGTGLSAAFPRLIDTILGCLFAWAGMVFIWPDWKFRRLGRHIQQALESETCYLHAAIQQYHHGRDNSVHYRSLRRQAHNRDAELASLISTLETEPHFEQTQKNLAFEFLCLNHTFLSYIGALAAHRELLTDEQTLQLLNDAYQNIQGALLRDEQADAQLIERLQGIRKSLEREHQEYDLIFIVLQQLYLILNILPRLSILKQNLMHQHDTQASELASL
ncbi:MAG: YccS family putative transporter [Acinetobacter sp.]|nr:YccS family putative transporter [Acinetobacter sp.]